MVKKSKKKYNVLIILIPLVFLAVLLFLFLSMVLVANYQYKQKQVLKCDTGFMPKNAFLTVYEVKKGDTLLSIAKNELGNVNRVDELIEANRDQHRLSISSGFLEVGYLLYLPPKEIHSSSGEFVGFKGEIATSIGDQLGLRSSPGGTNYAYIDDNTVFEGDANDFKEGDCIKIIWDEENRRALTVEHQ